MIEDETSHSHNETKTQVMTEKEAYEMTYMLEGVITHGTGTAAAISRPAAGKTGTTDNNVDAWFVGYTPDIVTAVWIGDDTGAHSLGEVYGGTIPAEIWRDYMSSATEDAKSSEFSVPAGMERITEQPKEEKKSDAANDTAKKKSAAQNKSNQDKQKASDTKKTPSQAARNNKEQ